MERAEVSVVVNRPIKDVWNVVSRIEDHPKFMSGTREASVTSEGEIGPGTTYRYVGEVLGRKFVTEGEITAFDPPRLYGFRATKSPFPLQGEWILEEQGEATKVTLRGAGEPGGFFQMATPLLMKLARRQLETDLNNLKDLLEAQAL